MTSFSQEARRGNPNEKKSTQTQSNNNRSNSQQSQPAAQQQKQASQPAAQQQNQQQNQRRATDVRTQNNRNEQARQGTNAAPQNRQEQQSGNNQSYHRDAANEHNENHAERNTEHHDNGNHYGNDNRHGNDNQSYQRNYGGRTEYHSTQPSHVKRDYVRVEYQPRRTVVVNHTPGYSPRSVEYRRAHYIYKAPVHRDVLWSISLSNDFRIFYPEVKYWRYETGYRLPMVSSYDAYDYIGDAAVVYGQVADIIYENETDEYFLYFGDYYPYQDFTAIVPGSQARLFDPRPGRYFQNAYLKVNGYVTEYNDKPEMVIRSSRQIENY